MKNYDVSTISVLLDLVGVFNSQKIDDFASSVVQNLKSENVQQVLGSSQR